MEPEKALEEGYTHVCFGCGIPYKGIPTEDHDDGHGTRKTPKCQYCCGSSFVSIKAELQKARGNGDYSQN